LQLETHRHTYYPRKKGITDFSKQAIIRALERNAVVSTMLWANWPMMEIKESAGSVSTITSIKAPIFNNVLYSNFVSSNVFQEIEETILPYIERGVPMLWWIGQSSKPENLAKYLEAKDLECIFEPVGMSADLLTINETFPVLDKLQIVEVNDEESLKEWCEISSKVFEVPEFALGMWHAMHRSVDYGYGKPIKHFLAKIDGKAVGTSSLFLCAGVAGISSVATISSARKMGVGTQLTLEPLRLARRLGYRIGVLFSSKIAANMFKNLGFLEYCRGKCYLWPG